jgi:transposase
MQKALEQMNVKLAEVVSDISGLTGMAIMRAILAGEREPLQLAKFRNVNCQRTEAEIARALYGNWRAEHLFALQQAVTLYDAYREQLRLCDEQMQAYLATLADQSQGRARPRRHGRGRRERRSNDPAFDVAGSLFRMSGVDLTVLEGIDPNTALVLSEIGPDVSRFPTVKHFCSWLGLSPQHQQSAGKIRRRRVQRGASRAGRALRLVAQACHHAQNVLGAFYRRIQGRAGAPKAIVATAHKLAERVYRLLKHGADYVCQDLEAYEASYRQRVVKAMARKAAALGYRLEPVPAAGT